MEKKKPAAELQKLKIFEGTWKIEGKNYQAAPDGSDQPVNGEDHYHWLEGNFFMVENWQHQSEGRGHKGISVLGFDEEVKKLFTRNFDNIGFNRKYILEPNANKWKFIGEKERAERTFSEDGKTYSEFWEIKNDKGEWISLCKMNGTKL